MADKKFYRYTYKMVILTDKKYYPCSLEQIGHDIDRGDYVGSWDKEKVEVLTPAEMAEALFEIGSEPEFFGLEENDNVDWWRLYCLEEDKRGNYI